MFFDFIVVERFCIMNGNCVEKITTGKNGSWVAANGTHGSIDEKKVNPVASSQGVTPDVTVVTRAKAPVDLVRLGESDEQVCSRYVLVPHDGKVCSCSKGRSTRRAGEPRVSRGNAVDCWAGINELVPAEVSLRIAETRKSVL